LPVDDPKRRRPDISQARALMGWEPKVRLRKGLEQTVEYFEQLLEGRIQGVVPETASRTNGAAVRARFLSA